MAARRALLALWLAAAAAGQARAEPDGTQPREATDPNCPPPSCCKGDGSGHGHGFGDGRCFGHPMYTEAYCCAGGPAADCYRWGEDSPGSDVAAYSVISGVQCRHLCQAHESCAFWTYIVDRPELGDQRARCYLKSAEALGGRVQSHGFVVSGERLCGHFGEGLTAEQARAREGFGQAPWRTAAEAGSAEAAGLGLLPSAGTPGWHLEAAAVFAELGFVAVIDALNSSQVEELRAGARRVADGILAQDPGHLGNRGPRRYSFGAASRTNHLMHIPEWPQLLDNAAVGAVLQEVFPEGYFACGGGGDFVLGGASTYQSLHLDIGGGPIYEPGPPPGVGVNYIVEDLSCADAPMRVLPGTHRVPQWPPVLTHEPRESKERTLLCPLPAGTAIVRDLRAWHGGTPNGSDRTRLMPNAEFVSPLWGQLTCGTGAILDPCQPVLPSSAHERMSPHGRKISASIVDSTGALEAAAASGEWMVPDPRDFTRHSQEAY